MKRQLMLVLVGLIAFGLGSNSYAQSQSRQQMFDEIAAKRKELSVLEQQFLDVSESDRNAFAELLSAPNTGLVRLLPRELFDGEAYKKVQNTITLKGGGTFYSFVRLTHDYGAGSDISLDHNQLSVGFAGFDFGMLLKIDDVSLQELSSDYPYVVPLVKYEPPTAESAVRNEQRRFSNGTNLEGLAVKSSAPLEINATYLLRSISYSRSDVLVGLKVIRKDSDGSVIIAWRLLKKFTAPEVAQKN